jgi:hypothetical protein
VHPSSILLTGGTIFQSLDVYSELHDDRQSKTTNGLHLPLPVTLLRQIDMNIPENYNRRIIYIYIYIYGFPSHKFLITNINKEEESLQFHFLIKYNASDIKSFNREWKLF